MSRSSAMLLNNRKKVRMLKPKILKPKNNTFRDFGGDGDSTWDTI